MGLQHRCQLCNDNSERFFCEDLAQLHVIIAHPGTIDDYAKYVRVDSSARNRLLSDSWSRGLYGLDESYPWSNLEFSSPYPLVYERLSELLALVARSFVGRARKKQKSFESYTLMMDFSRFSIQCGNVAKVLAESQGYCMRVSNMLRSFGYNSDSFHIALQEDEDELSQLASQFVYTTTSVNIVLGLSNNPFQARDLLDVIDKLLIRSASFIDHSETKGNQSQCPDVVLNTRSRNYMLRSKFRRISIKLAGASGQMPSSLYLIDVKLSGRDSVKGGAFADIFKGEHGGHRVAVKRLRLFMYQTQQERTRTSEMFSREALIWKYLDHPNVLPFLGIDDALFCESSALCMVSPWMKRGNIREYVDTLDGAQVEAAVLRLIKEIAFGLSYLHAEGLVHGDLRGPNILIDDQEHARLADFGLASFAESASATAGSVLGGATAWMAPELHDPEAFGLSHSRPSLLSDIYSYGCVCWELHAHAAPFHPLKGLQLIRKVLAGDRPSRTSVQHAIPDGVWVVVESCWRQKPEARPSASDLRVLLRPIKIASSSNNSQTSRDKHNSNLRMPPNRLSRRAPGCASEFE